MGDAAANGSMRGWAKRVEARIALAMSRAQAAFQLASVAASPDNAISVSNPGVIAAGQGPGSAIDQVTLASAAYIVPAGKRVMVQGSMHLLGGVTNQMGFTLVRNPGGVGGAEAVIGIALEEQAGSVIGDASASLTWVDAPAAGSHTYGIRGSNNTGGVISVPGADQASVTLSLVT